MVQSSTGMGRRIATGFRSNASRAASAGDASKAKVYCLTMVKLWLANFRSAIHSSMTQIPGTSSQSFSKRYAAYCSGPIFPGLNGYLSI